MQVRDALADHVVHRHERPRLPHRLRHGDREQPGILEERADELVGQVAERLVVIARQ
jgi:hypothetical protein